MNGDALTALGAVGLSERVRGGELRAEKVVEAHLERIRRLDPSVKAFLAVFEESALESARALDARISAGGKAGRLAGVPVALKDNILVRGEPLTCGSRILEGYRAPYDATVVERLRGEDAILIGKTNLDEFAMGSSTENSAFFPTRNPWDLSRVPGGSSGGSAAAVAARLACAAFGSDTGGSIRQPAAFCGVVGLKPGYGTVSRWGLVAFASSLDQVGPIARTAEDAALCLSVVAGHDPRDATSTPGPAKDYPALSSGGVQGLRIGLPREYFAEGLDRETERAVREAAEVLGGLGARVSEVSLPHTRHALSSYYLLAPSEASANLARFDGVRYGRRDAGDGGLLGLYEGSRGVGFGAEVKRRIMLGTYALSSGYHEEYYRKAQKVRTLVRKDFDEVFLEVDLCLTPTAPTPPFRFGEKSDPLQMYLSDAFTIPCNMAGICGVSVPCALNAAGLPLGVQFLGPRGAEGLLLRTARNLQEARPPASCPDPAGG